MAPNAGQRFTFFRVVFICQHCIESFHWLAWEKKRKSWIAYRQNVDGGHRTVITKNINEARTILEHTDLEDIMRSPLNVVEQILDEKLILRARFGFWEFHHLVPLPAANINAWTSGRPVLSYFVVVPSFILTFAAQALSVASLASSTATLLFGSHCDVAVSTMFSHQRRAALV